MRGQEEINTTTGHWDLSLVLPACSALRSISLERREARPTKGTEGSGSYLFASSYQTRSPWYARRDTKVSQISDWRIASKIARRVNNRYVFASRVTSRGMSAFWMHPCLARWRRRQTVERRKKRVRFRGRRAGRKREKETFYDGFHSAKWNSSRRVTTALRPEAWSRNWSMAARWLSIYWSVGGS